MRATLIAAAFTCLLAAAPALAEQSKEAATDKPAKALALSLPASTDECLKQLEAVLEQALDADMLDDQVDEAEEHLEKLEAACHDGRFAEALSEAKAVEKLISMNK